LYAVEQSISDYLDHWNPNVEMTMRKFIVAAVAATSFLAAASAANAGYWWNGLYYPTCFWNAFGQYFCY
jgi:hypothetical protein